VRAEGGGKPMSFVLQAGHRHESIVFEQVMDAAVSSRPAAERRRYRPKRVAADKAYSNRRIRAWLRRKGIRVTIPRKSTEHRGGPFDKQLYKLRAKVEQLINRLKQFRRIATRYEKRGVNYLAMVTIGAILLWL
jgi:transposase